MAEYKIRIATVEDAAALASLRYRFKAEEDGGDTLHEDAHFIAECTEWLKSKIGSNWVVWIAEAQREIWGHVYLSMAEKVPSPHRPTSEIGYVTNFYVVPNRRNCGIGSALLDALKGFACERRMDTLIVWPSERSIPLYSRSGFEAPMELLEHTVEPS